MLPDFYQRWQEEARQRRELEHEQKLADIRTQSRALIWTGTEGELVEEITKFYRAGLLKADDLPDALQKAAIHFVSPDGKPIIKPANILPEAETPSRFKPMDEKYQSIEFDGRQYDLTPTQAIIVRVLHKAHLEKRARVGIQEIYKALSINSGKMSGWFRDKNKPLYGKLIVQSAGRHHYRLDL